MVCWRSVVNLAYMLMVWSRAWVVGNDTLVPALSLPTSSVGLRFMASENGPARTSEDDKGRQAAGWKMASVTAQGSTATLLPVGEDSGARPQGEVAQTFLCSLGLSACLACVPICLSHYPLPPTWSQHPYSVLQLRLGLPSPSPSP